MRILPVDIGNSAHRVGSSSTAANSTANAILPHGIYNDSSVSIVALGDGDKRLFFQEGSGNIRESLFTQSTNSWTSDINNIVVTDARNNTPLVALLVNSTGTPFAVDTGPVVGIVLSREQTLTWANRTSDLPLLHYRHQPARQQTIHFWLMDHSRQLFPRWNSKHDNHNRHKYTSLGMHVTR